MNQNHLDFAMIQRLCGQDLSIRLQGALRSLGASSVRIVNTGMVSSGKSSLYNLLTDNATTNRFPTGAARTTTYADAYSYKDMEYIDTPGIDVQEADDEIAYRTVMEADLILMVHNIKTGPLTRSETDWLSRIVNGITDPEMRKCRIIFVCTWKDTRENEPGYEDILKEVRRMVFDTVGAEVPFFDVSINKYLDGIKKGKEVLCEKSGIPALKAFVEDYAKQYAAIKQRASRESFEQVAAEVRSSLEQTKKEKKSVMEKNTDNVRKKFTTQRNIWKEIFYYFKVRREAMEALKTELSEM